MMGLVVMIAIGALCASIWPLSTARYMAALACVAVLVLASQSAQAMSVEACNIYTTTATGVLKMRQEGYPKREIVQMFKDRDVYSQVVELAVISAFSADAEVEAEDFRASTFKRCRANEL